ncbi:hypothetical protein [Dyella sp. A6]|uniref:hypothetical protein n=1 Tax=Dyella aluminiiresistens TaxID=3069105 RepID=UPI002E79675E|nr:hypothetical protein [Dyella sp. A6]
MSVVPESLPVAAVPARRALYWCLDGLRLWWRAPFRLFVLCALQLLVETILQLIPWIGVALSKLVVPVLLMGILLGLDERARGGHLRWSCLLDGMCRRELWPVLALAAMWGLGVFAVQQAVAWLVYGWPAVDAVLLGHAMAHRELMTLTFMRVLLLPGVLVSILLLLAPCLLLFDGQSPWRSITGSVRMVLRHASPFGVLLLIDLALFLLMLSTGWTMLVMLPFVVPWSMASTYVVWRDLRSVVPTPVVAD